MTTRLEILVSTHGENGLKRCADNNWPSAKGIAYIVSCQYSDTKPPIPATLANRDDIKIIFTTSHGLSENRNNCLDSALADYILIADNDTDFYADALYSIIETFDANSELDIITMRYEDANHRLKKTYPADGHDISKRFKGYYVSSIEIALRRRSVSNASLRFSKLAGIGAPRLNQGEEQIFIFNALRRGLHGRHIAKVVACHADDSTGRRNFGPAALRSRGVLTIKERCIIGWVAIIARAWKIRSHVPFFKALRYMTSGGFYYLRHRHQL